MFPTPSTTKLDRERVYEPAEDSFLFLDLLQEELPFLQTRFVTANSPAPLVVELGLGSGIVTTFFHKNILPDALFIGTDINPYACHISKETSKENGNTRYFDVLRTNLWDGLRPGLVDILLFNPPYVPDVVLPSIENAVKTDDWLDFALLGGPDGMQVTSVVLDRLAEILNPVRGVAYILFCRRNRPFEVAKSMRNRGWVVDMVDERKAGWEVLSVWKFTKS
ncbi:S-adenosyl-L-methionine-dependent methyltransferase [Lipomyces tetrasporus]|uniref:S-adenosyl-L-methionine-dependent methyltransferase n=1 Tax=Lipomyces tetrasporus TaxID=54092 RepID=A0AAD7VWM4_9ASCO|nr:S-adenosyl-L-methionine-dependent methyltransferase [Lipomyces tetrasporus]KAJ8104169.1 S-adenosyl-L-methionine-dependent methyltransferase [Lipomyces tetrasporus]